jgi:hypothetical protein
MKTEFKSRPAYLQRDNRIIQDLHKAFGFDTAKEIVSITNIKKFVLRLKKKIVRTSRNLRKVCKPLI